MTAKNATAPRNTVKYPRVVPSPPPHVVAPKVADPSGPLVDSPLSNSPPTAPSLETDHLYEYVKWALDIKGGHILDAIVEVMHGTLAHFWGGLVSDDLQYGQTGRRSNVDDDVARWRIRSP